MQLVPVEADRNTIRQKIWKICQLVTENGRQRWVIDGDKLRSLFPKETKESVINTELRKAFEYNKTSNPNSGDQIYRYQAIPEYEDKVDIPEWLTNSTNFCHSLEKKACQTSYRGIHFYKQLQADEGHWPGDYGGPLFLLPGLIIASYITKTPFSTEKGQLMIAYMLNHQNEDGGWGLHIEGDSTMFGSVMQYCALRLLGMSPESKELTAARLWIHQNGGATGIPSWGKFFLSLLGVYEWKGCNSLMPEMWLLPKWLPIHPWRYWCHARMVYLPMSYCYGHKLTGEKSPLIEELRGELYTTDYDKINWSKQRNQVATKDSFFKSSPWLKVLFGPINWYEKVASRALRRQSMKFVLEYVEAEDAQTKFIDIGPVNQIINSVCVWHAHGKDSEQFRQHVERWDDYLWLAEDGLKMNGYNGSQLWDTAFAIQAMMENQPEMVDHEMIEAAYKYFDYTQIKEEVADRTRFFRHPSVGGWPFSTLDHGWPISDCTAEGLKAVLSIHNSEFSAGISQHIEPERLEQSVDLILSFQNKDGGWATYENTRSGGWLEFLNPSEVFGKIMIDYSWVECTSACITALIAFRRDFNKYRRKEIDRAIERGIQFIIDEQNSDGSWIGSWGVCFTYGTWFGVEALSAYGQESEENGDRVKENLDKACSFLISKQKADGGWGESHLSCVTSEYAENDSSQVVNTSWALLSLMAANYSDTKAIKKGVDILHNRQRPNGDWLQESISGVFNQNCMITYTAYRNVFPIWAIGRYLKNYSKSLDYRGNS